jgi:subtilisin family serine protease
MKTTKTTLTIAISLALSASVMAGENTPKVMADLKAGRPYVADELIVQYKSGVQNQERGRALGRVNANEAEMLVSAMQRNDSRGDMQLVQLPVGKSMAQAIKELEADPAVEFAEPNWIYQHAAVSNDNYYTDGTLWGMYGNSSSPANQFGSQAGEKWLTNTECGTVWVGIIDEGYMYNHEDLAANAGMNPGEVAGDGIDNDGNGYVDDVYGWDFDGNNNTVFDGAGDDHGTHVAGTIGGVGGNAKGVAGVCWSVNLFSAKFLGRNGGTTANAIKAVDYMTDMKTRHNLNMIATNNSWGGGGFSQGLQDAIERANDAGILFIAAAGNDSYNCDSGSNCYPAEYPNDNVIAVASITNTGALSSFSSYGQNSVDICAPGSAIMSTVPKSSKGQVISGYASYSGTSMATPHVAGAAALYKAINTGSSHLQVKSGIMTTAVATSSCNGKVVTNGRLDVSGY